MVVRPAAGVGCLRRLSRLEAQSVVPRLTRCASATGSRQHEQQPDTNATQPPSVIRGPPSFTLEASVGAANPLDLQLLATGAFGAEVHPDLPIATTWLGLYKQLALKLGGGGAARQQAAAAAASRVAAAAAEQMGAAAAAAEDALSAAHARPVLHVATVGAQLRSLDEVAASMCCAAGVTPRGAPVAARAHAPHADALLLVSGSHPARQLPLVGRLLPGTLKLLQRGAALRREGVLPQGLELWAVANPVVEADASYAEAKVAAGAQVLLTQPPLDWGAFEAWLDDAARRGVTSAARLLVGFPCISSAANCSFWLALCNAGGNAQCKQLEQQFRAEDARAEQQQQQQQGGAVNGQPGSTKGALSPFVQQWNRDLLAKLQATPGVAGLHVMPITGASKRLALQLAQEGGFDPPAWPLAAAGSPQAATGTGTGAASSVRGLSRA